MDASIIGACAVLWALVAIPTILGRSAEVEDQDVGAIAAGVFWPIYLPYRLFLIVRSGKP